MIPAAPELRQFYFGYGIPRERTGNAATDLPYILAQNQGAPADFPVSVNESAGLFSPDKYLWIPELNPDGTGVRFGNTAFHVCMADEFAAVMLGNQPNFFPFNSAMAGIELWFRVRGKTWR